MPASRAAAAAAAAAAAVGLPAPGRGVWTLVTGQPGCGKTTLVKALLEELQMVRPALRVRGFYTDEVLGNGGTRTGFDVVTVDGRRGVLSRKNGPAGQPKTGLYSVNVPAFEALAIPTMNPSGTDVVVIDEIGRMELHSEAFRTAVLKLLASDVRVVGAITAPIYGHRVPFCDHIEAQANVEVIRIKKANRDAVTAALRQRLAEEYDKTGVRAPPKKRKLGEAGAGTPESTGSAKRRRRL